MRFTEHENRRRQPGVADPQGRLHALRRTRLPEGVPRARARSCSTPTASSISIRRTASAAAIASPAARSTFRASRKKDHKAYKCTLCSDRVAVGLEPACVKTCPTGAIVFGTKEDMKEHAAERIVDLKSRGFENAGLYDPAGVGGTHVMYVLHHADTPELYAGLPEDPRDQPVGRAVERRQQAPGAAGHGRGGAGRVLPLHARRPQRDRGEDEQAAAQRTGEVAMSDATRGRRRTIVRYTATSAPITGSWRSSFLLAALSGLALFHPALFWLSNLFGGGHMDAHPASVHRAADVLAFLVLAALLARQLLQRRLAVAAADDRT